MGRLGGVVSGPSSHQRRALIVQKLSDHRGQLKRLFFMGRMPGVQQFKPCTADFSCQPLAKSRGEESIMTTPKNQGWRLDPGGLGLQGTQIHGGAQGGQDTASRCRSTEGLVVMVQLLRTELALGPDQSVTEQRAEPWPTEELLEHDTANEGQHSQARLHGGGRWVAKRVNKHQPGDEFGMASRHHEGDRPAQSMTHNRRTAQRQSGVEVGNGLRKGVYVIGKAARRRLLALAETWEIRGDYPELLSQSVPHSVPGRVVYEEAVEKQHRPACANFSDAQAYPAGCDVSMDTFRHESKRNALRGTQAKPSPDGPLGSRRVSPKLPKASNRDTRLRLRQLQELRLGRCRPRRQTSAGMPL